MTPYITEMGVGPTRTHNFGIAVIVRFGCRNPGKIVILNSHSHLLSFTMALPLLAQAAAKLPALLTAAVGAIANPTRQGTHKFNRAII
jgi:hypothetical protein